MAHQLTNIGEEWSLKTNLDGASVSILVYNDATDDPGDADDLSAITTEPSDGNYSRQSATLTFAVKSSDGAAVTSAQVSFDMTDTTASVDSYGIVANFESTTAGDSGAQDHLVATGALSQTYDLSNLDTLNVSAETMGHKLN
jgi:hypothetical protein